MQQPSSAFSLISPTLGKSPQSEAQVLGAVSWLLMQSSNHQELPLKMLGTQVLPPIKAGQYILLSEPSRNGSTQEPAAETPVAWLAWANLSPEAEACYLSDHLAGLRPDEWNSGERTWFMHWIAPFGHTRHVLRAVLDLLPNFCARSLHHRGIEHGMRVNTFRGKNVSAQAARQWWRERPMLAVAPASGLPAISSQIHGVSA